MLYNPLLIVIAFGDPVRAPSCPLPPDELVLANTQREVVAAWDRDDPAIRDLVDCQILAARSALAGDDRKAGLKALCSAIEVDFSVCNDRRPELDCAEQALQRFGDEGCLEEPDHIPIYHHLSSMYWRRRFNPMRAEAHLEQAGASVKALMLDRLSSLSGDTMSYRKLVLEYAIYAGERSELAAQLRNQRVLDEQIRDLTQLMPLVAIPEFARAIAVIQNQVGWAILLAREAELTTSDPVPWLTAALTVFGPGPSAVVSKADNTRINLALAAIQGNDVAEADRWIAEIVEEQKLSAEERLWLDLVRVRTTLAHGRIEEAATWQANLLRRPAAKSVPMAAWFAAWTRGLVADVRHPDQAVAAYLEAEALLEGYAQRSAPVAFGALGEGRYLLFAGATRRLIDLLHATAPDLAATIARRARNRATRMAGREACGSQRAFHETRETTPGELKLLFSRVSGRGVEDGRTGWIGFAITADHVTSRRLTLPPVPGDLHRRPNTELQSWSDELLLPFGDEIDDADRIVILPTEDLHTVPFHALPWAGGQLLEVAPVMYALDWGGCATRAHLAAQAPHSSALILSGQEPRLAREGGMVEERYHGSDIVALHMQVKRSADLGILFSGRHAIAHLAAHGQHRPGESWLESDDKLRFGDNLSLSREDVLAGARVPALVHLSACQSSFVDTETLGGGVSVAQAFLLRGSEFVVGATHEVDELVASQFAVAFHAELVDSELAATPEVWQAAYLRVSDKTPPSQYTSLRMLRLYVP